MQIANKLNPPPFKNDDYKRHITFGSDYFMIYQQMITKKKISPPSLWKTISDFVLYEDRPIFDWILHDIRNNYEAIHMEEIDKMLKKKRRDHRRLEASSTLYKQNFRNKIASSRKSSWMSPCKISETPETIYESESPFNSTIHSRFKPNITRKQSQNTKFRIKHLMSIRKAAIDTK